MNSAVDRTKVLGSIRLLVLDADGVLTDGRLYFGVGKELLQSFHARDGFGLRQIIKAGLAVAIISGRKSAAVARRARELGIAHVLQGVEDKGEALQRLCRKLRVSPAQCAVVGDDVPDLPMMSAAGLAVAVADAHPEVLAAAQAITEAGGGRGAVREVCDWLLAAQHPNGSGT